MQQRLHESEAEVQVLLAQVAVQSQLGVASSREIKQLHHMLSRQDPKRRKVTLCCEAA